MATPDTQMNIYLNTIAHATKGKDMRSALHDAIEKTYNDSYEWADDAVGKANTAISESAQALNTIITMAEDIAEVKEDATQMTQEYSEISSRVDNIIAHNNDTEGNSELIDIRTGSDGYVAGSAGTSVRRQVTNLNTRIDNLTLNNPRSEVSVNEPADLVYESVWENSSPTANFAGQTISFTAVEGTIEYAIDFKEKASESSVFSEKACAAVTGTKTKRLIFPTIGTYGVAMATRDFQFGSGSVVISDAKLLSPNNPFSLSGDDMTIVDPSASSATNNSYLIPVAIYAVKHMLNTTLQVSKDTELVDARVGVDGVTYQTLGTAIRTQIAEYLDSGVIDALSNSY